MSTGWNVLSDKFDPLLNVFPKTFSRLSSPKGFPHALDVFPDILQALRMQGNYFSVMIQHFPAGGFYLIEGNGTNITKVLRDQVIGLQLFQLLHIQVINRERLFQ